MAFSSVLFVFRFLPAALILYYAAPKKAKNFVLLIVSLVFYSWGEVRYLPVMLVTIVTNYLCAIGIDRFSERRGLRRLCFGVALFVSFGFLFVFKYLDFLIGSVGGLLGLSVTPLGLTLPLGISFYTFQTLSYTIDVFRKKVPAERSFIDMAAFVVLFPQLIAGPIVRYTDVAAELKTRTINADMLERGAEDFVIGLGKKVLLANNVGALWTELETIGFGAASTGLSWLALVAFSLQLYFDFSGYSQMAIGLGRMMGFNFPENFDFPYASRSATEFWRRWHITLGSWFREYLYFPLGGSRCSATRNIFNLFVVWACTGLWHGAGWNFLLWGLYFFLLLVIEKAGFKRFLDKHTAFSHVYALFAILFGWALFQVTDMQLLGVFLNRLFVPASVGSGAAVGALYYLKNYGVSLAVSVFFAFPLSRRIYEKIKRRTALKTVLLTALFVLCVAYLVDATYNPFLYFRF